MGPSQHGARERYGRSDTKRAGKFAADRGRGLPVLPSEKAKPRSMPDTHGVLDDLVARWQVRRSQDGSPSWDAVFPLLLGIDDPAVRAGGDEPGLGRGPRHLCPRRESI